jgi:hypothetical protein
MRATGLRLQHLAFCAACLFSALTSGQEQIKRRICDPAHPPDDCLDKACICVPDTLEITFNGDSGSILEYEAFDGDKEFEVLVVTETRSRAICGWSFGVAHDTGSLTVTSATTGDTDVEEFVPGNFDATAFENIQTCGPDPECAEGNRTDGGGIVSAMVICFKHDRELPLKRNSLVRATYKLAKDVGPEGTLLRITDRVAARGSPPVGLNLTVDGRGSLWMTAIDGWIKRKDCAEGSEFQRGDIGVSRGGAARPPDGAINLTDAIRISAVLLSPTTATFNCEKAADVDDNGSVDAADVAYLLAYLFLSGSAPPEPFATVGLDPAPDSLSCCWP